MPDLNFENALAAAPCGVLIFDEYGDLLFANTVGREIFAPQNSESSTAYNLLNEQYLIEAGDMERIRLAFAGQRIELSALCLTPRSGSELWLHCVLCPNMEQDGRLMSVTVYAYNISQYRALEHQLMEEIKVEQEHSNHLSQAQRQLQQSEKLATLGQLAAGIAHEINNPIGYIGSNINTMKSYLEKLLPAFSASRKMLNALEKQSEVLGADTKAAINDLKTQIDQEDLDYMLSDLSDLVAECAEGIGRVKRIVMDMKNFSRNADDEYGLADIHVAIDTALSIAGNEIKHKAVVKKEYSELPDILCSSSQMNQIFLNILVNAAQAIPGRGVITIRTRQIEGFVQIEIEDDGPGIDEEGLSRLFNTFYTTKPVGEGTGLGLPIAKEIVTRHGGEISVRSKLGEGTCFDIRLPLDVQENAQDNYIEGAA